MHNYPRASSLVSSENTADPRVVSCSVVGARGYSGLETARLLLKHPNARLDFCFATTAFKLSDHLTTPAAVNVPCLAESELLYNLTDVVFLATPAPVSLALAPKILAAGKKVIDLSGAFRLKSHNYADWYEGAHTAPAELQAAQYGLVPWAGPASGETRLIANPGCYATAIAMALIPLVKRDLIDASSLVIDAKSGTSGAGRKAAENMLFTEVDGECLPYRVGRHQHYPEICETVAMFAGQQIDAHVTTSLLPVRRGIIAGIYARIRAGVTLAQIEAAFAEDYANDPLVRHGTLKNAAALVSLKRVVGTPETHIAFELNGSKLYLFSCIDNLLKGAASQAIENFNRLSDLPTTTGLQSLEALT